MVNLEVIFFWLGDGNEGVFVVLDDGLGQILIRLIQFRRLIDQVEYAQWVKLKQIDDRLVVLKANVVGKLFKPFLEKLILFFLEDVGHIELLQFLVSEVDEKLLQRVDQKNLKPEYI